MYISIKTQVYTYVSLGKHNGGLQEGHSVVANILLFLLEYETNDYQDGLDAIDREHAQSWLLPEKDSYGSK